MRIAYLHNAEQGTIGIHDQNSGITLYINFSGKVQAMNDVFKPEDLVKSDKIEMVAINYSECLKSKWSSLVAVASADGKYIKIFSTETGE